MTPLFSITDFIPNGGVMVFAALTAWIFRDHTHRDDARFKGVSDSFRTISEKLDKAVEVQSKSHAEILKILLEQKNDK